MISFIDLAAQQQRIRSDIDARIAKVLDHGQYIMGPEVAELEAELASYAKAKHVISCSSGTDALILALIAFGLRPGQGVIVPSFTFAASAEAIAVLGAIPVFAEIDGRSFNLDADRLDSALSAAHAQQIDIVGIMAVGLFGQPANITALSDYAQAHNLWMLDDAAQSFGGRWQNRPSGSLADITATSFFPAKPLGCYGDGGAVFTDDDEMAERARSARIHGQGSDKYENIQIGMTARLDTVQAAILLAKMAIFDEELQLRNKVADRYEQLLSEHVTTPFIAADAYSSWAQYVIILPEASNRADIQTRLSADGIPSAIYYPRPMHTQPPYKRYPVSEGGLAITEYMADHVLALPMHPYLDETVQRNVADGLISALG
ncbi:MAG: DegT/DnrJ/EryC1/StrS family aminotransferase [Candidatus Puniceispirillaceae bacterium]|jgi:dTDP-4-amino-4,6-dideoxygalactose transaminase